jgi:hypothetical protein
MAELVAEDVGHGALILLSEGELEDVHDPVLGVGEEGFGEEPPRGAVVF